MVPPKNSGYNPDGSQVLKPLTPCIKFCQPHLIFRKKPEIHNLSLFSLKDQSKNIVIKAFKIHIVVN